MNKLTEMIKETLNEVGLFPAEVVLKKIDDLVVDYISQREITDYMRSSST